MQFITEIIIKVLTVFKYKSISNFVTDNLRGNMSNELANKPLVEALFEIKWELKESKKRGKHDPNYKILVGMLYDKLNKEYPYFEPLDAAELPDEMAAHIVQNRFRVAEDQWPVVQIGPGIITVNDTQNYKWEDFEKKILNVLRILIDIYPNRENLVFNSILLRYINVIEEFEGDGDTFAFLKENMHTEINLDEKLFEETGVKNLPLSFEFNISFGSTKPKGAVILRLAKGKIDNRPRLGLETMVLSLKKDVPNSTEDIHKWIKEAHNLTDDWFFKLIEGDLKRRFE